MYPVLPRTYPMCVFDGQPIRYVTLALRRALFSGDQSLSLKISSYGVLSVPLDSSRRTPTNHEIAFPLSLLFRLAHESGMCLWRWQHNSRKFVNHSYLFCPVVLWLVSRD